MPIKYIKTVSFGSISADSTSKQTYTFEEGGTLKYILVNERSGASLNALLVTLTLSGDTLTRDVVPASILGEDMRTAFPIEKAVRKGDKLDISIYNGGSSAVNVDVCVIIEE